MSLMDLQKKIAESEKEYFTNLDRYIKIIKKRAKDIFEDARVYLFGSVVEGDWIPGKSDIDVLIVSDRIPKTVSKQVEIRLEILRDIGFLSPFEIHLADEEIFQYYRKNIKKMIEV